MHPLFRWLFCLFSQSVMWPFNLIHAFSGTPNQSVSQSCRASSCCMHSVSQPVIQFSWSFRLSCVTHQSFASFVHSFSSSQLIHSYSADDSGAKRKYRELKRLPADIRAQVALLKVHHTYTTWSPPPSLCPGGRLGIQPPVDTVRRIQQHYISAAHLKMGPFIRTPA